MSLKMQHHMIIVAIAFNMLVNSYDAMEYQSPTLAQHRTAWFHMIFFQTTEGMRTLQNQKPKLVGG